MLSPQEVIFSHLIFGSPPYGYSAGTVARVLLLAPLLKIGRYRRTIGYIWIRDTIWDVVLVKGFEKENYRFSHDSDSMKA